MRRMRPVAAWSAAVLGAGLLAAPPFLPPARAGAALPAAASCPMLPADNVWNTDISSLPVNASSPAWMASLNASSTNLHPDFGPAGAGQAPYGIPYTVVDGAYPKVPVSFQYAAESDPGPYPLGADTPIEGGQNATGDRHALVVDSSTCTLYELYGAQYSPSGSTAGSGAVWDLNSDALRPAGWTSADAAGLPILPGLLRLDEVESGSVTHAIRMTAARTDTSYLWPARHEAGTASNPALPPMGARFRLKAGFNLSSFSPMAQTVLRAMQHYGLIVADNGSNWYFTGASDPGWPTSLLDELKTVPASAFEAIDESSLMVDPNSGQARSGQPVVPPPAPGPGYRLVARDGGVFGFAAAFYGSTGNLRLNRPIAGAAPAPDGRGYWLVASDGGIFAFGDAAFFGSTGGLHVNRPIVGMAPTADGRGYWLVASDGGIFAFGDAAFAGSGLTAGGTAVGIAAAPGGRGYWVVTASGSVEPFGGAGAYGSPGAPLNQPVVALAPTPDGGGYWLLAADGGVFAFGDAPFQGSLGGARLNQPVVGITSGPTG